MLQLKLGNREILKMYYESVGGFINLTDIKVLFDCKYKKAAKIRDEIKVELANIGKSAPLGYVPFDLVLQKCNTNITLIEEHYMKQQQLKLGGK